MSNLQYSDRLNTGSPIPQSLRSDLQAIANFVPSEAGVLDLGCGDGALLAHLVQKKRVRGRGIELSEAGVLACVHRGLSVRQGNLQEGLADYPDKHFDTVVLSQTVQFLDDPGMIVSEMLRVGHRAIVSFPNWGHWRSRLYLLVNGRIPPAPDYPQAWHATPRWQAFTVRDFVRFCQEQGFVIQNQVYLSGQRQGKWAANLMAETAVFVLS